jgi:hypothetical protein
VEEVVKCPNCGKPTDPAYKDWCPKCGKALPKQVTPGEGAIAGGQAQSTSPVVDRYRDAYRVGAALVGLGNTIKVVGAILGGIIIVGSLSAGNGPFTAAGLFLGAAVGLLFWVCGVMVAAQGQVLQATLDTAVNSSHFLTDPDRADAMGLPRSVADRTGA